MPTLIRERLTLPADIRCREAASCIAQLDDQTTRLMQDVAGLSPETIGWQPAPGMNTIGMLLAHNAIVEVFWTQVGPLGLTSYETESVLGINIDDDGMPLPEGGAQSAVLAGKPLAWFADLHTRARAYSRKAIGALADADLDRVITRTRRDGSIHETDMRWVLYHMVEHYAGHYGQINLLAHQARLGGPRR